MKDPITIQSLSFIQYVFHHKCWLCDDGDEMINHISKCSKLVQNKSRHNWVGKMIYWELCKMFKFELTNKWYMHSPESIQENEIQTDRLISARRPDLIIIKKKKENLQNYGLYCPGWPQSVNLKKAKRKINTSTLLGNWKRLWNMKVTVSPIVIGTLGTVTEGVIRGRVETIQTTELLRSVWILRRDLRRLAVTQPPVKDHQLTLMWKPHKK